MIIGRVTGYEIGTNLESEENVLLLQVELSESDDIQTIELFGSGGRDYNPPTESKIIAIPIADALQIAVAVNDGIEPESEPGEVEIYSVDEFGGSKQAKVKCFVDGKVKINDGGPGAARLGDQVKSTIIDDPTFFAWMQAVSSALALTAPTQVVSKITSSSSTVEIGD